MDSLKRSVLTRDINTSSASEGCARAYTSLVFPQSRLSRKTSTLSSRRRETASKTSLSTFEHGAAFTRRIALPVCTRSCRTRSSSLLHTTLQRSIGGSGTPVDLFSSRSVLLSGSSSVCRSIVARAKACIVGIVVVVVQDIQWHFQSPT
jgi:hypothetical protein